MNLESFPPVVVEANTAPSLVRWVMKDDEVWLNTGLVSPPEMTRKKPWTWALFISLGAVISLAITALFFISVLSVWGLDFRDTLVFLALSVVAKIVGGLVIIAVAATIVTVLRLMSFKRVEQEWIRKNTQVLTPLVNPRIAWHLDKLERQIQSMGETLKAYEVLQQGMEILKNWNSLPAPRHEEGNRLVVKAEIPYMHQMDQLLAHATDTLKD